MSAQATQTAQPTRIIVQTESERTEREPRDVNIWKMVEPLIGPALVIGGLGLAVYYRNEITAFINDVFTKTGSQAFQDLIDKIKGNIKPLPPITVPQTPTTPSQQVPAGGTILYTSNLWASGGSRTLTGHHQFDKIDTRTELAAGSNRRLIIDGNGNAQLSGDQARIYIHANNYNSAMFLTVNPKSGLDNLSLKLRSRHNEGGSGPNRFGGYGVSFHFGSGEIESKREDYHNVHTSLGSCKFSGIGYNRDQNVGMSVQDAGGVVNIGAYFNGQRVCTFTDKSPKDYMLNKSLYGSKSYSWIRTNGGGSAVIRNVQIKEIGPLAASNLVYTWPSTLPQPYLDQYYNYYYPYMKQYKRHRRMLEQRVTIA